MESLNTYKDQITGSIATYETSVQTWTTKEAVYKSLLGIWSPFEQLRENPIDVMRIEFLHAEIAKQREKLQSCRSNLHQFEDLERKMRELASAMPDPAMEDETMLGEDQIMDIREDLDEDGNIIKSSLTPQNKQTIEKLGDVLTDQSNQTAQIPEPQHISEESPSTVALTTERNASGSNEPDITIATDDVKKNKKKKRRKKSGGETNEVNKAIPSEQDKMIAVSDQIVEHETNYDNLGTFNVRETSDGSIELTADPQGYSIGVLPPGLAEMTDIVNEMDWENDEEEEEEDESEDEFGRSKHSGMIPLPGLLTRPSSSQEARPHVVEHNRRHSAEAHEPVRASAQGKKKLVFADKLEQGPSAGTSKVPAKPVLKKKSSYPILDDELNSIDLSLIPSEAEPKKSRFKLERSSTDTRISMRHAQPSQSYQERLDSAVASDVVERLEPMSELAPNVEVDQLKASETSNQVKTETNHEQLFPRKINLAGVDLHPEDGTVKAAMSIPKMSEEQLAAIRKKRELLGKKHKRRKSADPSYPVRSSSWDESQPLPKPQRRLSSGEDEQLGETMKSAKVARAKELLKAQDDIAWANAPISPDDHVSKDIVDKNPLAAAGYALKQQGGDSHDNDNSAAMSSQPHSGRKESSFTTSSVSGVATPPMQIQQQPMYAADKILSPRPRKPPTPERRGSYTNIPSPLRQEIQPYSESKEVQFSSDVIKKLEPLMEHETEPTVVIKDRKARKMPPQQPRRKTSVDPQNISPTPKSPPPEGRRPGPLQTEEDGSVSHYMVRATSKSPPPHIAIHDLLGDTPEHIRQSVKNDCVSPSSRGAETSSTDYASERNPMDENVEDVGSVASTERKMPSNAQSDANSLRNSGTLNGPPHKSINGIVEHTHPATNRDTQATDSDEDIDDEMHRKEIAHEYHRLRQRMVAANGGYVKEEEGAIVPLDEEDPGPGKRISRFKAARLGQKGPEK